MFEALSKARLATPFSRSSVNCRSKIRHRSSEPITALNSFLHTSFALAQVHITTWVIASQPAENPQLRFPLISEACALQTRLRLPALNSTRNTGCPESLTTDFRTFWGALRQTPFKNGCRCPERSYTVDRREQCGSTSAG